MIKRLHLELWPQFYGSRGPPGTEDMKVKLQISTEGVLVLPSFFDPAGLEVPRD